MQATGKGSDQPARMHRLILGFAGRTYNIVGNLMLRFIFNFCEFGKKAVRTFKTIIVKCTLALAN